MALHLAIEDGFVVSIRHPCLQIGRNLFKVSALEELRGHLSEIGLGQQKKKRHRNGHSDLRFSAFPIFFSACIAIQARSFNLFLTSFQHVKRRNHWPYNKSCYERDEDVIICLYSRESGIEMNPALKAVWNL